MNQSVDVQPQPPSFASEGFTLSRNEEIDVQIQTAKKYPRKLTTFKQRATQMATLDEETAASMFYALPRGGKPIEGPSIRIAEVVASAYGNLRVGARIIEVGEKYVTAQGACHDLENNVAVTVEVRRRITNKNGSRYNDDMIGVTSNAALSIAARNAIFKVIPMAYTKPVYQAARKVAIGDARTLAANRAEAIAYFGKMGATEAQVLATLGVAGVDDVGLEQLALLKGLATAIRDGETTVDAAFPPVKPKAKPTESGNGKPNGNGKSKLGALAESMKPAEEGATTESPEGESAQEGASGEPDGGEATIDRESYSKRFDDLLKKHIAAKDRLTYVRGVLGDSILKKLADLTDVQLDAVLTDLEAMDAAQEPKTTQQEVPF